MDLNVMKYVVQVAELGNFSQAAKACHVCQPTLSQQIAKLERELAVQLFLRTPKGAVTTEAGAEFVRRAKDMLLRSDELRAEMSLYAGLLKGNLTLGLITSLQCIEFGDMLAAFVRSYPNIAFSIRQFGTYQLIDMLQESEIDLAFINRPKRSMSDSIAFEKLGEDRYALAVPYDHPLAQRSRVSMAELREERFIFHQPWQVASELIRGACNEVGFEPNVVCCSGEPTITMYMVQGGMGIALFPSEEFDNRSIEGIKRVELEETIIKEVGVAWRKDSESPLISTVVRFAKDWAEEIS